jgi:hypothetical protein
MVEGAVARARGRGCGLIASPRRGLARSRLLPEEDSSHAHASRIKVVVGSGLGSVHRTAASYCAGVPGARDRSLSWAEVK